MAAENRSEKPVSNSKYGHLTDDRDGIPDTVRATEDFPAGPECDLTCDDVPDDEDAFGWTTHYENESRERTNPDVTEEIIDTLLNDSVVRKAPGEDWDNRYLFQTEIDGSEVSDDTRRMGGDEPTTYEWTMIVADDGPYADNERWVLITVYSNYHGSVGTTNKYFDRLRERRGE